MLQKQLVFLIIIAIVNLIETKPTTISTSECFEKILPSAIIIGVKKSGTYALIRYLSINPFIKVALKSDGCNLNEIHYFDRDYNYARGVQWYAQQMPSVSCSTSRDSFISIEKTPGYFKSKQAPRRARNFNSNLKLLLIVRDPVKRLQSELTHCEVRQTKFNLKPICSNINAYFEQVFANETNLDQVLLANKFIRNSIYYLDMLEWLNHFNMSNFYVVNGEEFIREPWSELNRVEKFLNVTQFIRKHHFQFDRKKNFYCLMMNKLNTTMHGCLGKNKGRKRHVYLSQFVKTNLRLYFSKWNELFFNLIGKKFNW